MKLTLLKLSGTAYDITHAVDSVTVSGSVIGAARQIAFNYINAPYDKNYKDVPMISSGDYISFKIDRKEVFFGQIFDTEKSSATGTLSYTAYDDIRHLTESSGQYNFKNLTAEAITARVLDDVQVKYSGLAATGVNIKSMLCDNESLYDIVLGAYTQASKVTKKKYIPGIKNRRFTITAANSSVANFCLDDTKNITDADIQEQMSEITNIVKIVDDKGKQIGEVKNGKSVKKYGVFQQIYQKEDGVDPTTGANALLKVNPVQTINISAVNDDNCLSGYDVQVKDKATGLAGLYFIKSDKHTYSPSGDTMELELSFKALMDEKEITEEEEKKDE